MTEQPRMATYVGGPLDGQNAIRTSPKFSRYRDDDGKPLNSARGDHEFVGRPKPPTRFYCHEATDPDEPGYGGRHFYVHGSVWRDWWGQRLAARRRPPARQPVRPATATTAPARLVGGAR